MKTCIKCCQPKALTEFHRSKQHNDGLFPYCRPCRRLYNKSYNAKHKEHIDQRNRRYYHTHRTKLKRKALKRRNQNREECVRKHAQYKQENPKKFRAYEAKRRAAKLQATPAWLTLEDFREIRQFYEDCPEGHQVDHIVPLLGKSIRGLHVLWNLQYLTPEENMKKGNKCGPRP